MHLSTEQQSILEEVLSGIHPIILIRGFAGTGKSVLLREIRKHIPNALVPCPTGIAANNVGGQTFHSLFGVPTTFAIDPTKRDVNGLRAKDPYAKHFNRKDPKAPKDSPFRFDPAKYGTLRATSMLIPDEGFAIRCDHWDFMDKVMRKARKCDLPFGGVRIVIFGDEGQSAPIAGKHEATLVKYGYAKPFDLTQAHVFKENPIHERYLTKIFRQQNATDGLILARFRSGTETASDLAYVNRNVSPYPPKGYTILSPWRHRVDTLNELALDCLNTEEWVFNAKMKGTYKNMDEKALPYPSELRLKAGCRVIIKKNEKRKVKGYMQQVYNGDQGTFIGVDKHQRLIVELDNGEEVLIKKVKENNGVVATKKDVCINPDAPEEEQEFKTIDILEANKKNSFEQYPVRLGFAITISASQGMTLSGVYLDLSGRIWDTGYGLLYVALSRVKSLDNLYLSRKLTKEDNMVSPALKPVEPEQHEMEIEQ